jgi:hypothetical protein
MHVEAWWRGRGDFDLKGGCSEGRRCEGEEAGEGLHHLEDRRRAGGCKEDVAVPGTEVQTTTQERLNTISMALV